MEAMDLHDRIAGAIRIAPASGGVRVSTHCLYPSNSAVSVMIQPAQGDFVLSDEGGATIEISDGGFWDFLSDRKMGAMVKPQGLEVEGGVIHSPRVSIDAVPGALMLVANASRDVASWGRRHLSLGPRRNFKQELTDLLDHYFASNLQHDAPIIGASTKPHKFGHVITLPFERRLLIDPATNDASSINACVVSNLDVKMVNDPQIIQLIVYDDATEWPSSSLNLLQVGAQTVPFSAAARAIQRLAA